MDSIANILNLPNEILVIIFEYLFPSDRRVASECCKRFLEIWLRDEFIKDRRLVFNECILDSKIEPCSLILKSDRKYQQIKIDDCKNNSCPEFWKKLGETVTSLELGSSYYYSSFNFEKLPKLNELRVAKFSLLKPTDDIPYSLEKLIIDEADIEERYVDEDHDDDEIYDLGADDLLIEMNSVQVTEEVSCFLQNHQNKICKLELEEGSASEISELKCKNLKHLDVIISEDEKSEILLKNLEKRFPLLDYFSLTMYKNLPWTNWSFLKELSLYEMRADALDLLKTLQNLETLRLKFLYDFDYEDEPEDAEPETQCIFTHDPFLQKRLKTLRIGFYPLEPEKTCLTCFKVISETFPNVENLNFEFAINNEQLDQIQRHMQKLKNFSVDSEETGSFLSFEKLPNLIEINLCSMIRPEVKTWPLMPYLRKLDISIKTLNKESVKFFEKVPSLEDLNFYCEEIRDDPHQIVETLMKPLKRIKNVDLTLNMITTLNPNIIDTIATNCKYLRNIHMFNNFKGQNDDDVLINLLEKHSSIRRINHIHGNYPEQTARRELSRSIMNEEFGLRNVTSNQPSSDSNLVTIHKRNGSPTEDDSQEQSKRYKIVPNSMSNEPSDSQGSSQGIMEVQVKQEINNLVNPDLSGANVPGNGPSAFLHPCTSELAKETVSSLRQATPVKAESSLSSSSQNVQFELDQNPNMKQIIQKSETLPVDRIELVMLLKNELCREDYKLFLIAITEYRKNTSFDLLSTRLLQIFGHPAVFHYLIVMKKFLKDHDKNRYDTVVNEFLIEQLK